MSKKKPSVRSEVKRKQKPTRKISQKKNGKKKERKLPDGVVRTHEEIARSFNVSVRSVYTWKRDGMPVRGDGTFDLRAIQQWKFERQAARQPDPEDDNQLEFWQAKEREAKAKKAEMEYQRMAGELVPIDEVERGLIDASLAVKKTLLGLPRELAPLLYGLDAREIEIILTDKIKDAIAAFASDKIFTPPAKKEVTNDSGNRETEDMDAEGQRRLAPA